MRRCSLFVGSCGALNVLSPMWDNMRHPSICYWNSLSPLFSVLPQSKATANFWRDILICHTVTSSDKAVQQPCKTQRTSYILMQISIKKIWIRDKYYNIITLLTLFLYINDKLNHYHSKFWDKTQTKHVCCAFVAKINSVWKVTVCQQDNKLFQTDLFFIGISGGSSIQ